MIFLSMNKIKIQLLVITIALYGCATSEYQIFQSVKYDFDNNFGDLKKASHTKPHAIQRDSKIVRAGSHSVRFEVRQGDKRFNSRKDVSYRAELYIDKEVLMNVETWYGFSLFIPKDFPIEDNRLVIGQWWSLGEAKERWAKRSPVLALRFVNGRFYITTRNSRERIMAGNSGKEAVIHENYNFPLGIWNDFIFQVKWSYKEDGFVNVWQNGKQIVKYSGGIGYNDDRGPIFKVGIYKDDSPSTYIVYFDEVRMAKSFQEVDPSQRD